MEYWSIDEYRIGHSVLKCIPKTAESRSVRFCYRVICPQEIKLLNFKGF